ncbi:VOC family protein [Radiobacillus kanasensis]|uniref:VOC family protein n=1 Tax=Radiobacillus kanasensis TaxID=2844358 RepID=UPI001E38E469|nr:VOC family protein [Radiobacillus kanasensis]UFT98328.1 VOC family protein [Radiobacillus kanasensis]
MIKEMYPYLVMNGNGKEAVHFYEAALGAEVLSIQTFADMPDDPKNSVPPEAKDRVLNAQLKVGGINLMLSDTFPGQPYEVGDQVTIALVTNDAEETKEIFTKLKEGGQVGMELQETFWSPSYGQVTDKFGVSWQVSTEG